MKGKGQGKLPNVSKISVETKKNKIVHATDWAVVAESSEEEERVSILRVERSRLIVLNNIMIFFLLVRTPHSLWIQIAVAMVKWTVLKN